MVSFRGTQNSTDRGNMLVAKNLLQEQVSFTKEARLTWTFRCIWLKPILRAGNLVPSKLQTIFLLKITRVVSMKDSCLSMEWQCWPLIETLDGEEMRNRLKEEKNVRGFSWFMTQARTSARAIHASPTTDAKLHSKKLKTTLKSNRQTIKTLWVRGVFALELRSTIGFMLLFLLQWETVWGKSTNGSAQQARRY